MFLYLSPRLFFPLLLLFLFCPGGPFNPIPEEGHNLLSAQDSGPKSFTSGRNAYYQGQYVDALNFLKRATQEAPNFSESYYFLALACKKLKQTKEMLGYLKLAIKYSPDNEKYKGEYIKFYDSLIQSGLRRNQDRETTEKIKRFLDEILEVSLTSFPHVLLKGNLLIRENNFKGAREMIERSVTSDPRALTDYQNPNLHEVFALLAFSCFKSDDFASATKYRKTATNYPNESDRTRQLFAAIDGQKEQWVDKWLTEGRSRMKSGDKSRATEMFKKVLSVSPGHNEAQNSLESLEKGQEVEQMVGVAREHLDKGRFGQAVDLLEKAVQFDPQNDIAGVLLAQARVKFKRQQEDLANQGAQITDLSTDTVSREAELDNLHEQAKILISQGKLDEASILLIKIQKNGEKYASLRPLMMEVEKSLKMIKDRDTLLRRYKKAKELYDAKEYQQALELFDNIPSNFKENPQEPSDLLSYQGFCKIQVAAALPAGEARNKQILDSKTLAEKQIKENPKNLRADFVVGYAYYLLDDFPPALEVFDKIIVEDPTYPMVGELKKSITFKIYFPRAAFLIVIVVLAWLARILYLKMPELRLKQNLDLGRKLIRGGHFQDGIDIYTKIPPNILTEWQRMVMFIDLAYAYRKIGDFNSGIVKAKESIRLDPTNEEAKEILGWCYLGKGQGTPETIPSLTELYKKEKTNLALVELLAKFYISAKNTKKEAIEIFDRLMLLDPSNMEVTRFLAGHFLKTKKMDKKALKVFQALVDNGQDDNEVRLGLARIQLSEGKIEECIQLCNDVLERDIQCEEVHSVFRDAYRKANQLGVLMESYENLLEQFPHNVAIQNAYRDCKKLFGGETSQARAGSLADMLEGEMKADNQDSVSNPFASQQQDSPFETPSNYSNSSDPQGESSSPSDSPWPSADDLDKPQNADTPSAVEGENSILCRSCRYNNTKGDYYCQNCGQPL